MARRQWPRMAACSRGNRASALRPGSWYRCATYGSRRLPCRNARASLWSRRCACLEMATGGSMNSRSRINPDCWPRGASPWCCAMADRRHIPTALCGIALSVLCSSAWGANAEPELVDAPLWEAGLGVGAVVFPVYRGAATTSFYALPLPYFVYRGNFFRADHNGASLQFVDSERVQLHFSAGAGPPVKSSDVAIRAGMPDLRPTIELGPSLEIQLWRS